MNNTEFLVTVEGLLTQLEEVPEDYWASLLPSQIDDVVSTFCTTIMNAAPEERALLRPLMSKAIQSTLLAYASRMTMLSVRQGSRGKLLEGLVALAMLDYLEYAHEILMTLSKFYNSALRLAIDPGELFRTAATYAIDERTGTLLLEFLNRSPHDKSLAVMGLREIEGPSGLVYWNLYRNDMPDGWL